MTSFIAIILKFPLRQCISHSFNTISAVHSVGKVSRLVAVE